MKKLLLLTTVSCLSLTPFLHANTPTSINDCKHFNALTSSLNDSSHLSITNSFKVTEGTIGQTSSTKLKWKCKIGIDKDELTFQLESLMGNKTSRHFSPAITELAKLIGIEDGDSVSLCQYNEHDVGELSYGTENIGLIRFQNLKTEYELTLGLKMFQGS